MTPIGGDPVPLVSALADCGAPQPQLRGGREQLVDDGACASVITPTSRSSVATIVTDRAPHSLPERRGSNWRARPHPVESYPGSYPGTRVAS